MLSKLTGWQIVTIFCVGMVVFGYGLISGRLDATAIGGIVALFGAWRAPTGPTPPSPPAVPQ